jgi:hypothetical protein
LIALAEEVFEKKLKKQDHALKNGVSHSSSNQEEPLNTPRQRRLTRHDSPTKIQLEIDSIEIKIEELEEELKYLQREHKHAKKNKITYLQNQLAVLQQPQEKKEKTRIHRH